MNLQEFQKEFDLHFFTFVKEKIKDYKKLAKDKETRAFFSHLELYMKGGKRLRPYGAYLGFVDSGKALTRKEWLVFIALELIHVLALIHDDIIDKAVDRRGLPTIHSFVQDTVSVVRGDKKHFANSQALLVGDIVFAAAFQALRKSDTSIDIQEKIHQLIDEVIVGQMIDVNLAYREIASKSQIVTKSKYKTAFYTFARPFEVGAMLGGLSEKKIEDLTLIGELLGLAYQTQDDYLDVFGSKDLLQKEILNDIREGQQTLVTHYFFEVASKQQQQEFEKYFGKSFSKKDTRLVLNLLETTGVKDIVFHELLKYFVKTKKILLESSLSETSKQSIQNLITLLEKRN